VVYGFDLVPGFVPVTGIDVSATAIRLATERREDFIPDERAHFAVGSLEHTGLPDACAHGLICEPLLPASTLALWPGRWP
jgi:hypothetical protein